MNGENAPVLRVATYNVHACVGTDRQRSESRIAEVIAETGADIAGLQELDLRRPRSRGVDQAGVIAEQLGWHGFFHPAMQSGDEHYGDAIISRFPLTLRRVFDLPGPPPRYCREKRGAISMDVETPLGPVHMINTHFGLGRTERLRQAEALASAASAQDGHEANPLILLGDFNSLPGSRPYRAITKRLNDVRKLVSPVEKWRTFPTFFPLFALDHIFIDASLRPLRANVHHSALARTASDHYPLCVEVVRV